MKHQVRPLFVAFGLVFAVSAQAAKPAKPASKPEAAAPASGKVEIELSHEFGKEGEEHLQTMLEQFNKNSKDGTINLVRSGKSDKPAVLSIIRRASVPELLSAKGNVKPIHQLMSDAKLPFNAATLSGDLRAGVSDEKGRLVGLPVAYSTPVLFYNKNAFRKARLDPDRPPATWFEMQGVLDKLQDAGYTCPYTTSYPTWVHIDNVSALSGEKVATAKGELAFNGLPQVKHVAMMATWQKANFFKSFGRTNEADKKFEDGECAMITTNAWAHTEFREAKGVELGVAPLPHHDDVYGGRQHTLADGASLWAGAGHKPAEYKLAARFVEFLLSPEQQIALVRDHGVLPLTAAARSAAKSKLLKDTDRSLEVAYAQLKGEGSTHPLRLSGIQQVRQILDEELEAVWSDKKPAKAALDTAVQRGNAVLGAKPGLKKALPF